MCQNTTMVCKEGFCIKDGEEIPLEKIKDLESVVNYLKDRSISIEKNNSKGPKIQKNKAEKPAAK